MLTTYHKAVAYADACPDHSVAVFILQALDRCRGPVDLSELPTVAEREEFLKIIEKEIER